MRKEDLKAKSVFVSSFEDRALASIEHFTVFQGASLSTVLGCTPVAVVVETAMTNTDCRSVQYGTCFGSGTFSAGCALPIVETTPAGNKLSRPKHSGRGPYLGRQGHRPKGRSGPRAIQWHRGERLRHCCTHSDSYHE